MSSTIESVLHRKPRVPAAGGVRRARRTSPAWTPYRALCAEAERDFEGFWARLAREELLWHKPFTQDARRVERAVLQVVPRRRAQRVVQLPRPPPRRRSRDKVAIIFEADDGKVTKITYQELYHARLQASPTALKSLGIKKGDRVLIYMPMSIEARGRDAGVRAHRRDAFGGVRRLLREELQERIIDAGAVAVITADGQFRGGKRDAAEAGRRRGAGDGRLRRRSSNVVVYKRTGDSGADEGGPRRVVARAVAKAAGHVRARRGSNAEHPLFILYTSGSTGKPKGVQHSTGGYLLRAILTMKWTFDYQADGHLLVHGRHRLGDRAHLHRVRAARRAARPRSCSKACRRTRTPAASGR